MSVQEHIAAAERLLGEAEAIPHTAHPGGHHVFLMNMAQVHASIAVALATSAATPKPAGG